jgi:hypothetical protein
MLPWPRHNQGTRRHRLPSTRGSRRWLAGHDTGARRATGSAITQGGLHHKHHAEPVCRACLDDGRLGGSGSAAKCDTDPTTPTRCNQTPGAGLADMPIFFFPQISFKFQSPGANWTVQPRQFPLRLAYAATFNRCQGLTLGRMVLPDETRLCTWPTLHQPVLRPVRL